MLPDYLSNNLSIVFCGTAVGHQSARAGHYYANPTNKFWRILYEVGLTPRLLSTNEDYSVNRFGIGLTDLVKGVAGRDKELSQDQFSPSALTAKILKYEPKILCFNGKKAAQVYFDQKDIQYGLQPRKIGKTQVFVASSTSGGNGHWDRKTWVELAALLRK